MSDIIAIGGGGFVGDPANPALEKYLIDQAQKPHPNVLMIATARGDDAAYVESFHRAFRGLGATTRDLPFFHRTPDLRQLILDQDVIYVGGGNTRSMLAVWREWGLPEILKEAYDRGIVLGGQSAGAICWFEQGVTDSWADRLRPLECMGFLSGSCCPHYDGEVERRPAYHGLLRTGQIRPGYAIDDRVAAHFRNGKLERVVSKRPGSTVYRVTTDGHVAHEVAIEAKLL
jgi:peptidase E